MKFSIKSQSLKWFLCLALPFFVGCQKKEVKPSPRCIYDQTVFAQIAKQAVASEEQFATFKRDPFFNLLWENGDSQEGEIWLQRIREHFPSLLEKLNGLQTIDAIGSPRVFSFGEIGAFSPSTLRLAYLASDVHKRVQKGDSRLHIVQIGTSQGALCKFFHDFGMVDSYTLVDLPEQLALAKKCLHEWGIDNVICLTPEELPKTKTYDLAISDMSFSEFNAKYQNLFLERVFAHAKDGYLLGHIFPKHYGVVALNFDDLKTRLEGMHPSSEWEIQEPAIDQENYFIYWNTPS